MNIATFGSWIDERNTPWTSLGDRGQFEGACRETGQAIANLGHTIIVGSSRPSTADKHFVDGVLAAVSGPAAVPREAPNIRVIRPFDEVVDYATLSIKHPGSFRFEDRPGLRAAGVKALAVRKADVVLTIGGAEGTYLAGLAAILGKKPLIPIASFGGASRHLIGAVRELGGVSGQTDAHLMDALNSPWSISLLASEVIARLKRPPTLLLIHGRSNDWQELTLWLRKIPVNVIVMKEESANGRTLPEKFEQLAGDADGAIVLATPDDRGGLASQPIEGGSSRARENVWIEYGWFWGRLGRKRVMLLHKGEVLFPTDLNGLEYSSYSNSPMENSESIRAFLQRLQTAQADDS
jgi:Predicted nucleotide-binding protein containing TIR-like domain